MPERKKEEKRKLIVADLITKKTICFRFGPYTKEMVMKRWSKDHGRGGSNSADELYRNFWSSDAAHQRRNTESKTSSGSMTARLGDKFRHLQRPKIK